MTHSSRPDQASNMDTLPLTRRRLGQWGLGSLAIAGL